MTQRYPQPPSGSHRGRKLAQRAPEPSGLPSQGLPEPQDPPEGLRSLEPGPGEGRASENAEF